MVEALVGLLSICSVAQLRGLLLILRRCRPTFICALPTEIAAQIIAYFEPRDRDVHLLVNQNNDRYWEARCQELQIEMPRTRKSTQDEWDKWRQIFIRTRYAINWSWRFIAQPRHRIIDCHKSEEITCLRYARNTILTASTDHTLRLHNAKTGKLLHILEGHKNQVWCAMLMKTIAISGSSDATLKVWSLNKGKCIRTLIGHQQTVKCLDVQRDRVASGSSDSTIRLWNHVTGECIRVFGGQTGHMSEINCVRLSKDGKTIMSAGHDRLIKIWGDSRDRCLRNLEGHTDIVCALEFDAEHIVSAGLDTSIRVWDRTGHNLYVLWGHEGPTRALVLRGDMLVSANADHTLRLWNVRRGSCVQTLVGHEGAISSVQVNTNFIISASYDGRVKLWDRQSGKFLRDLFSVKYYGLDQKQKQGVHHICADNTSLVAAFSTGMGTSRDTRLGVRIMTCRNCGWHRSLSNAVKTIVPRARGGKITIFYYDVNDCPEGADQREASTGYCAFA
ncbi:F-box/WD repeat-containing protein 7-like [Varroa jacobsoni]|uniref:F-box/WD repeat-containing protein 7-like n=1 Tax=Varroa jacobsoni TaxID=62625 RepID=UPI000BF2E867|nr:F-box/WD repeat-containing protein 7-like [Varroa jacobsoni]